MKIRCPSCNSAFESARGNDGLSRFYPFCSRRCQLGDLQAWLDESYTLEAVENDLEAETDSADH